MLGEIIEMSDILHDVLKDERELHHWRKGHEIRKKNAQFEFWSGVFCASAMGHRNQRRAVKG